MAVCMKPMLLPLLVLAIMGMNILQARAQSCATNGGSPTQADVNGCVNYLRNLGSTSCCQTGSSGSCTTMCVQGSAAIDICNPTACTTCTNAGNAANTILANCVSNVNGTPRVAGSIGTANGLTVRVRHS